MLKRRIHDGIVGVLLVIGFLLGYYVDAYWFYLDLILGLLLVQSTFTGFCPVYFVLNKVMKGQTV